MQRILVTAVVLVILAGAAAADEIYIPDSNPATGGSNAIPFWAEWSAIQGAIRYQMLFSPAELGGKAFKVTEMHWAPNYTGSLAATQFQIRMSHSTVGTLNATMDLNIPKPTTLFSGPITMKTTQSTWAAFGLTGTFAYNGTDYLVVDIRYQGGKSVLTGAGSQGRCKSAAIHRSWAYTNYNATTESGQDRLAGMKTRFTVSTTQIIGSGTSQPGTTVLLNLLSPTDSGLPYQVGTSLGLGPTKIGPHTLGLSLDPMLDASVSGNLPFVFQDYAGILNAQGTGLAKLNLPAIPALVGVRLHSAFLTLKAGAPLNIQTVSPTFSFTVVK